MKRHPYWRGLLLSLAALFAALGFMLYSETGLRWGVSLLTEVVLKPLSVTEVSGRLAGPFSLSGIEYAQDDQHLSLAALTLDWKPSALLAGTAHVTALKAEGLHYRQQGEDAAPESRGVAPPPPLDLPVNLRIDEARIEGITIVLPGQSAPLLFTRFSLQAETDRDTLQLHSLQLEAERLSLALKGELQPLKAYALDLQLAWQIYPQDAPAWQGEGRLQGDLRQLQLQQQLTAPFSATLALTASDPFGEQVWQGKLTVPTLRSTQLPFPVPAEFSLGGVVEAQGGADTFSATSRFAGQIAKVGEIKGELESAYADRKLRLTRLTLERPGDPLRIEAHGDIALSTPVSYQLQANWQALAWPVGQAAYYSESGRIQVTGEERQYRFDTTFLLAGPQLPSGDWRLQGEGDTEAVRLSTLEGKLLDGTVSGDLSLTFAPTLQWHGTLAGRGLDPGSLWPQWPGRLSLDARFRGEHSEKGLNVAVTLPSVGGTLRERTLQGRSEAQWRSGRATLKFLELQLGSARLKAQGKLEDVLAFEWQLDAAELADLLPEAQGRIKAEGRVDGPLSTPRVLLALEGQGLGFKDALSETVQAELELDLQNLTPSRLLLDLGQLQLPGLPQQSVTLQGEGLHEAHHFSLTSHTAEQSLLLEADAGYGQERWTGTVARLQIDDRKLGQWTLAQPTAFALSPVDLMVDEFCLQRDAANLCAQAHWAQRRSLEARLSSERFPLELLAPYLPSRFTISGQLDGRATLAMVAEQPPQLEARLNLGEGELQLVQGESDIEMLSLPFLGGVIELASDKAGSVKGEFTLSLNETDRIGLNLQTSLEKGLVKSLLEQPLTSRLRLSIQDLTFISSLIPEVQAPRGTLSADVLLTGTLATPTLSGFARLDEGSMDIPRLGLHLHALQLSASGDNTRQMAITGSARSGDGELSLSGQLLPQRDGVWSLELAMKGADFEVAKIPEARMRVSPNLSVRILGREIHLKGELDIPYARLEPRDLRRAVRPSDDVVIINNDGPKAETERWQIHTHVRVSAEESIRFIGHGYDGWIGGELLLVDKPGSVTRGRGILQAVPGSTYSAFGRKLTVERGRLNFADSPVDNPTLNIRAARTIGDVIAGVDVSGTAKAPRLTLYSEPPMDQADILAYLTLGHPLGSANQSEGEALSGAASTAGLVGGNYLAGYIGRQFGLVEARVEAAPDTQSPWVVVGKYLSPRLYVRYGMGVYEEAYSVIVRYQLSEHWQLQGEGGLHGGGDIIYTFERP
ncbi:MAG: translocation/assembly module TamB domain-containing protein [Gammaproteobacteria bacterium]|nr:translocation/assembly module TamB domain-containing protein [Gammaproteobacteria bacterium]MCW8959458.1 translocation/assembly module TamB domain-containing protein [Gammaproteobacteria bacterium]MCW8972489.1 translocation/assembly module TamB domain-containing protein [Gammaproteobacteria bacterium]MCW8992161.1 translocation/assembly module TamB domain-containing protein [Gammaproteobacteria bacterium]